MADIIRLPNNEQVICFNSEEYTLGELIREKLGYDAYCIYENIINERDRLEHELLQYEKDELVFETESDIDL